jgi:DNA-binding transcriptional ArsR family regulator
MSRLTVTVNFWWKRTVLAPSDPVRAKASFVTVNLTIITICYDALLRLNLADSINEFRQLSSAIGYLITRENSSYTQIWNSLNRQQKIALKAVIDEGGKDLRSAEVLARYGLAASSMHKTLKALDSRGVIREEEDLGSIRYRLEDPFLARWLRLVQSGSSRLS